MPGFVPMRLDQFVRQYLTAHKDADGDAVRAGVEDALAAWRQGVRCACGKPIWVAGSAVAGYGCFACITGSPAPDGDPEIAEACDAYGLLMDDPDEHLARVNEIIRNHPRDYRERLAEAGFVWQDENDETVYEQEIHEERMAVAKTANQRRLIHFFENGGTVTRRVVDAYMNERYAQAPNIPLIRKYFRRANPHLKALLLKALSDYPTDADLLDDLAYFSEFDNMLGELIQFYTDACIKETDMDRFSLLAQDFHINTFEQGFDALHELTLLFRSGTKGAVIQHLSETIDDVDGPEYIPF